MKKAIIIIKDLLKTIKRVFSGLFCEVYRNIDR